MSNDEIDGKVVDFRRAGTSESQRDTSASAMVKLSSNIDPVILDRLRRLAQTHRLSESSITEIALSMFFLRGDDEMLAVLLRQLGAKLRRP